MKEMSASEQMRAMLDQLMGTSRNGTEGPGLKFSDPRVCKSFLYGCCPHEVLASTRMDFGRMSKKYFYDVDACEHLNSFIQDCDRRTELAKKRLAETQEELSAEVGSKAEKVHELAEHIGKKLASAEQIGAEGKVDESMKLMAEVEEIRKKKGLAEQEYRNSMPASSYQQQKLRIREKLTELLVNNEERRQKKRESRIGGACTGIRENSSDRALKSNDEHYRGSQYGRSRDVGYNRRTKSPERMRSRSRSIERRRRERSAERRRRDRSRDRYRRRRSRSRDSRRRRSRSKRRSRSRESRSRSRSHEKKRRHSNSRERKSKDRRSKSSERNDLSPRKTILINTLINPYLNYNLVRFVC
ncbi:Putative RNA-binding protein Luc7-like 2,Putative RNA-binding protein Luc7-like 1 [Lepeophtheirus salmonis]|uniref:RNA-binding protein Luc7-like 2,Putative RNA-binding protein Luc7-like 1 n=1 Tax=Lepeophtheirus salmonis TaxID=72036 RepID=A0A7R8H9T8_LEPSM|nr:Putative RNA-binding protein Luc7-like 2,Putative RNA-binding protein Luc7-like 1 [Lepeophtheirus salmonis]CAF2966402.1 Putative RNA-binding protein Luc7-like 2,Putative RNA-binding protein Luc7-like 1 [Lepeophtheirus salmonis]